MGIFVGFKCKFCQYEEPNIGVGHGKTEFPFLALYHCDHCKTIGSTWVVADKLPRCSNCYNDTLTILPDDSRRVNCPKCGETGSIVQRDGSWE